MLMSLSFIHCENDNFCNPGALQWCWKEQPTHHSGTRKGEGGKHGVRNEIQLTEPSFHALPKKGGEPSSGNRNHMQHAFCYSTMQTSWQKALLLPDKGGRDDHVYWMNRLCCSGPSVFSLETAAKQTPNRPVCHRTNETQQSPSVLDFRPSDVSWGPRTQKNGPCGFCFSLKGHILHMVWFTGLELKGLCGGAEAKRPQWHVRKCWSGQLDKLHGPHPQRRGVKWDNFTSFPHRPN